jgi:hypothetical protein
MRGYLRYDRRPGQPPKRLSHTEDQRSIQAVSTRVRDYLSLESSTNKARQQSDASAFDPLKDKLLLRSSSIMKAALLGTGIEWLVRNYRPEAWDKVSFTGIIPRLDIHSLYVYATAPMIS